MENVCVPVEPVVLIVTEAACQYALVTLADPMAKVSEPAVSPVSV